MIIRTSQDRNAVDCCPCEWPECDEPRKECESAEVSLCAIKCSDMAHPNPNAEENSILYKSFSYTQTQSAITDTQEDTGDQSGSSTVTEEVVATGVCGGDITHSANDRSAVWDNSAHDNLLVETGNDYAANGTDYGSGVTRTSTSFNKQYDPPGVLDIDETFSDPDTGVIEFLYSPNTGTLIGWTGKVLTYESVKFLPADSGLATVTMGEEYTPTTAAEILTATLGDYDPDGCASSSDITFATDGVRITAATAIKSRYRFAPPTGYARSTWEMEWDEVFASPEWWAWYDGGMIGTEPTLGPSLVAHRSWVWDGIEEWSEWFEIPVPSEPGETRVVNVQTTCWKSTRLGSVPTASGAEVAIPE